MAKKRKNGSNHIENGDSKRYRPSNLDQDDDEIPQSTSGAQSRVDPTYGQRGAFPGLDDFNGEEELFYGPASDGLEYLRMVR